MSDPAMEALRDKWFDMPDLLVQKDICQDMQALAFQNLPYFPVSEG